MHNERRTTRVTRVLALAVPFLLAGCGIDGLFGSDRSRVLVVLSGDGGSASSMLAASVSASHNGDDDDRGDGSRLSSLFQSAQVTLSSVMFRTLDGELVDADMDLPVIVDVVRIEGGRRFLLPDALLPDDTYDQVVFVMTAVTGTTRDGTKITIEPPGGGWTAVVPICQLEVTDGDAETVVIKLHARNSFLQSRSNWSFQPRLRAETDCEGNEGN